MRNTRDLLSKRSYRPTLWFCILAFSFLVSTGCANWNMKPDAAPRESTQRNESTPLTVENLVGYLKRESAKIQLMDCKDISIDIKAQGSRMPEIEGWMVCEKPRNFRLTGNVITKEVDIGSNQDLFWYWVKRNPEPNIYFCNYADFDKGVRLPFPFQPEWVLEVLGMGEYPDPSRFKLDQKTQGRNKIIELIEQTQSQGQPVTKVTILNRESAAPPVPQVISKELRDSRGQLIARATIKKTQFDKKNSDLIVPKVVVLEYPAQQVVMTITINNVTVNNAFSQEQERKLFALPDFEKRVDIAQMLRSNTTSNIRQTGQFNRN